MTKQMKGNTVAVDIDWLHTELWQSIEKFKTETLSEADAHKLNACIGSVLNQISTEDDAVIAALSQRQQVKEPDNLLGRILNLLESLRHPPFTDVDRQEVECMIREVRTKAGPTEDQIHEAATEAELKFWEEVTNQFPEVYGGEYPPELCAKLEDQLRDHVTYWLKYNHPAYVHPDDA